MSPFVTLGLLVLLPAADPSEVTTPRRQPNPLAPSLPLLTDAEEEKLDKIVDRFIEADIGTLRGDDAKQAQREFHRLGPDATFALMRGLNKAANIEASCPVVSIARKLRTILGNSRDRDLLEFARENIGAGVTAPKHKGLLRDLKVSCTLRTKVLSSTPNPAPSVQTAIPPASPPRPGGSP